MFFYTRGRVSSSLYNASKKQSCRTTTTSGENFRTGSSKSYITVHANGQSFRLGGKEPSLGIESGRELAMLKRRAAAGSK